MSNIVLLKSEPTKIYNVIVIGSGPAGHTCCLYLSRANLEPLMLEGGDNLEVISGGLLTTTKTVENFPGFPEGVDGYDLTVRFKEQSLKFGTNIISETCTSIVKLPDGLFQVHATNNQTFITKSVVIATGSTPQKLNVPGYNKFWHKGISTCAVCDGGLPCFKNVPLAVVGGGDSACEEALHLAHTASYVYLLCRKNELRASKIMSQRLLSHPKIKVLWNCEVKEINGDKTVENIMVYNNSTFERFILPIRGLFVAIGHNPNSSFVKDLVECDSFGYIVTTPDMRTSVPGIWSVGDVQDKKYKQAITAASSGCIAALEIERWLDLHV
jgi:thioredoxin reductase (NADPH)